MRIDGKLFVKEKEFDRKLDAKKYAAKRRTYGKNARVVWRESRNKWWVVTR